MSNDQNASKDPENNEKPEEIDTELTSGAGEKEQNETPESADAELSEDAESGVSAEVDTEESEQEIEDAVLVVEADAAETESEAGDAEVDEADLSVPGAITNIETPAASTPPTSAPAVIEAGPSTFGLVFGGLIAGAIGFLIATFAVPEGWPNPPAEPNGSLQAALDAETARVDALEQRITELAEVEPQVVSVGEVDLSPLTTDIATLSGRIDALTEQLGASAERIAVLEERPVASEIEAPEVNFNAEMDQFRSELEAAAAAARAEMEAAQARAAEVEAEAARAAEEAERAAEVTLQRAALAEISAALESGSPFGEPLTRIPDAPNALASVAEQGIPTLASLRSEFPDVARAALREVQSVPADAPASQRLTAFLRQQTNARSLTPQEGDDADAILSRAEGALNGGDLSGALAELSALPDGAIGAMSDWLTKAEARASAVDAAQSLAENLN